MSRIVRPDRRAFLKGGVAACAAAALSSMDVLAQKGGRARPIRALPASGGGGSQSLITASDLSFDGWHKFDTSGGFGAGGDNPVSLAYRYVSGNLRLFTWVYYLGDYGVTEYQVDAAPASTIPGATALTFVRYWGHIRAGHVSVDGGSEINITGPLRWDEARHGLWWSYGSGYVPLEAHPTLGFTYLDDSDGSITIYGPWRSDIDAARFLGGAVCEIPSDYASLASGADYMQMGVVYSGAAGCPQGANLHAVTLPNPFTQAPNYYGDGVQGFTQKTLIRHDYTHPQTRTDLSYAFCSWGVEDGNPAHKYDARLGMSITDGTNKWGGVDISADAASASLDAMTNVFFISTTTRRGVLYFGQQMCTPAGFTPVGDDKVHYGYSEYNHASDTGSSAAGFLDNYCAHMQLMAFESWHSTGPFCGYTAARAWVYDPNDLAGAVALGGSTQPYGFTPVSAEVNLGARVAPLTFPIATSISDNGSQSAGNVGGGVFNPTTKKIYLPIKIDLDTVPGTQRYAIAQIAVNC